MSEDAIPYGAGEGDYSNLISGCEEAIANGTILSQKYSEEEFEILIGNYVVEDNSEVVLLLSEMGYNQHPYSSEMAIRYADILIVNSEAKKALEIIDSHIDNDPDNLDFIFLTGRAYLRLRDYGRAREYIMRAYEKEEGGETDMLLTIGQDCIDALDFKEAIYYLLVAYGADNESKEVINDLAYCYERDGDLDTSIKYYELYLDKDPFNDGVWFNLGTIYARQSFYEKALEAFDYASALNPKNSSVLYNKAIVYMNTLDTPKAAETFEELLELEPLNIFAYVALGDCYITLEQEEKAISVFSKVLEIDDTNLEANTFMSMLSLSRSDYFGALVYLRRVASRDDLSCENILPSLELAYRKSSMEEYLVYIIICQYRLRKIKELKLSFTQLLEKDKLWLERLYELLPEIKNARTLNILKNKIKNSQ